MGINPRDCIAANAALYPPACPTRIRKLRLEIIMNTSFQDETRMKFNHEGTAINRISRTWRINGDLPEACMTSMVLKLRTAMNGFRK
jgi:hypothetical protein